MKNTDHPARYIAPRFWLIWFAFGLLWCINRLPFRLQMVTGRWLGRLLYHLIPRRRRIAKINLRLCFPDQSRSQRRAILKRHFESLGIMIVETGLSWWSSTDKLRKLISIEGLEHLQNSLASGKGAILLAAHFTTLEISGPMFSTFIPVYAMYRRHENPLINLLMERGRKRHLKGLIPREDIRTLLRILKNGEVVWYATDQGYRGKQSMTVPFFGVPASANSATSRIARSSGAAVLPFVTYRLDDNKGYLLKISPPLANFPSVDPAEDALRINKIIEAQIVAHPEQYYWVHRRFKSRDKPSVYN
jgi:KDO2-lipid IV(A) lauroyltransferase